LYVVSVVKQTPQVMIEMRLYKIVRNICKANSKDKTDMLSKRLASKRLV